MLGDIGAVVIGGFEHDDLAAQVFERDGLAVAVDGGEERCCFADIGGGEGRKRRQRKNGRADEKRAARELEVGHGEPPYFLACWDDVNSDTIIASVRTCGNIFGLSAPGAQ